MWFLYEMAPQLLETLVFFFSVDGTGGIRSPEGSQNEKNKYQLVSRMGYKEIKRGSRQITVSEGKSFEFWN